MASLSNSLRSRFPTPKTPHITSLRLKLFSTFSDSEQMEAQDEETQFSITIPKPTLTPIEPSPDADSLSQILIHHHNPFHHMESSLQLNGISLTPTLIQQTLLRLKHHSKIALAFFKYSRSYHHSCSSSFSLLDTSCYNILIDILCRVRQFDAAWQLILQMDSQEISEQSKPNFTTFFILIRRLVSAGLTRTAVRTFHDMGIFLIDVFDSQFSYCFCYLLDTLCKYGYVKVATEVFNKEKYRVEADFKVYTVLIYGWCKIGKIEMARRFWGEMLERGIEPNVVTYNILLNGICRHASLHPEGRFEKVIREAEEMFDEMSERGVQPDITSYSILLHVYSRAHKPQLSLDKLRMMRENGVCPSVATYTSVVKCLCSCGRIEDCRGVVK
ncbi:Pentatricopeptide repeat (PPR) superfamily protein [Abeliophyllum distichum]|uniref:Pentatricopeptide repeat (PPR) superfamily protein n=1 Tax=Abeliophyllum distichum TaxID=126358 RepID=A0ABD1PC25_9LAMI